MTVSPKLVITIDTEEDLWAEYRREGNPVENIGALPSRAGRPFGDFPHTGQLGRVEGASRRRSGLSEAATARRNQCHPGTRLPREPSTLTTVWSRCLSVVERNSRTSCADRRGGASSRGVSAGRWGFTRLAGACKKLGYQATPPLSAWMEADHGRYSDARDVLRFDPTTLTPAARPLLELPTTTASGRAPRAGCGSEGSAAPPSHAVRLIGCRTARRNSDGLAEPTTPRKDRIARRARATAANVNLLPSTAAAGPLPSSHSGSRSLPGADRDLPPFRGGERDRILAALRCDRVLR